MNKFLATLLVCCIMFLNFDANAEENSHMEYDIR